MQFWTTNGGLAVSLLFLVISGVLPFECSVPWERF
jgi:hypothetical protein